VALVAEIEHREVENERVPVVIPSSSLYSAAPVAASQSLTVSSDDADATTLPSGENAPLGVCSPLGNVRLSDESV